jgi:hypothetical protein
MSIEFVAQEFWDYINESETPVALKILESNYLFVVLVDSTAIIAMSPQTSTIVYPGELSTDYVMLNGLLTDEELPEISNTDFSTLVTSWSAPVDEDGHIIGASLFGGSTVGLQNGASYPGDYVADFTLLIQPVDETRGLLFDATDISWTDDLVLTLIDGTEIDVQAVEDGEIEPARVPTSTENVGDRLHESVAYEVAVPTPNDWGYTVETDSAYPEYIFPAAYMYWEREIAWIQQRMVYVGLYLNTTIGSQVVTLDVADDITDPKVYVDYATDVVYLRNPESNDLNLTDGTVLPFTSFTVILDTIIVPKTLGYEHYGFENEQFYMYKNVTEVIEYKLQVVGRSVVETPGTFVFVGEGAYTDLSDVYATEAAMLAALDAFDPVGAPHVINEEGGTAWSRIVARVGGGIQVGDICKSVTAAISSRYSLAKTNQPVDNCQITPIARIVPTNHYIYNEEINSWEIDEEWPGVDPITNAICSLEEASPTLRGYAIGSPYTGGTFGGLDVPEIEIDGEIFTPEDSDPPPDFPSASFNLQNGIPAPVYPTYQGAFIYDIELKKWGKMKMSFHSLLDFAPVNTQSSQLLPNARYGVAGGILDTDGAIFQWDANPTDAYIKYGKFSLFRLGMTTIQEIEAQFGIQSTGTIETETSLDGKTIELSLSTSYAISAARVARVPVKRAGAWHNIIFRGQFDLTYLQVNAYRSGRR